MSPTVEVAPVVVETPPQGRRDAMRRLAEPVLGGGGLAFLVSLTAATLGNLAFHAVVSRRLGTDGYGALSSLLAILMALSLPMAALQVAVTRAAAGRIAEGRPPGARRLLRTVGACALALAAALVVTAPVVSPLLDLGGPMPMVWLAAFTVPALVGTVGRGLLMAEQRFAIVAVAVVTATAVRLGLAAALVGGSTGLATAMAVGAASETLLCALFLGASRHRFLMAGPTIRVAWREQLAATASLTGLWLALGVDVVLARYFLAPEASGTYAAAATAARISLFLPHAIVSMAHARMSGATGEHLARVLRASLVAVIGVVALSTAMLVVGGTRLTAALLGPQFRPSATVLLVLSVTAGVLSVANLLIHRRLAETGRGAAAGWVGAVATVVLAALWHDSVLSLALASLAGSLVALAIVLPELRTARRRQPVVERRRALADPGEVDVSVVIAAFAPADALDDHLVATHEALALSGRSYEVMVAAPADRVAALAAARGRWVVHDDADGAVDPAHLAGFLDLADFYRADVVVGSKRHPNSSVSYPMTRRMLSRVHGVVVRRWFGVSVQDTRVGAKVFRREVLADALPHVTTDGAVFDLEVLALGAGFGHRRMVEAPVRLDGRVANRLRLREIAQILADTRRVADSVRAATSTPAQPRRMPVPAPARALAMPRRPLRPEPVC